MFNKVQVNKAEYLKIRAMFRKHGNHIRADGIFGIKEEYREDVYGNPWDRLQSKQMIHDEMNAKKTEHGTVYVIRESQDCDGTRASYIREWPLSVAAYQRGVDRAYEDAEGPQSIYMVSPEYGAKYEPYWIGGW